MMNKFLLNIALFVGLIATAAAQTLTSDATAATTIKRAVSGGAAMQSFQVTDTSGSANRIYIRDNDSTSITNIVMPAYTYYTTTATTSTNTFVNYDGVTNSTVQTALILTLNTNAASTNAARLVNMISSPANATVTWTPTSAQGVTHGIQLYSVGTTTYTLTYLPLP